MAIVDKTAKADENPKYLPSRFSMSKLEERDHKTGRVISRNPYRMLVVARVRYIEWPKGSGNLYTQGGEGVGRLEGNKIQLGKSHKVWNPPLTTDEKVSRENAVMKQELEALRKELGAVKREEQMKTFVKQQEDKAEGKTAASPKKKGAKV